MKLLIFLFAAFFSFSSLFSQENPSAYYIYSKAGEKVDYSDILSEAGNADVILFGELHNNPISHWLEYNLLKSLYKTHKENVVAAAEMFETDVQLVLNEYLKGAISEKNFKTESKPWNNYETDYKPLVEFCKTHSLKFIASNIPRRYASVVYNKGLKYLDSLNAEALQTFVPLPFIIDTSLKSYSSLKGGFDGHGKGYLLESQAIKDATMSHFILKNFSPGKKILHFNGSYHSDNFEGIYWYLKKLRPNIKIITIATVEQQEISEIEKENLNKADFIITVPKDMTKTY